MCPILSGGTAGFYFHVLLFYFAIIFFYPVCLSTFSRFQQSMFEVLFFGFVRFISNFIKSLIIMESSSTVEASENAAETSLSVRQFVAARVKEITSLTAQIASTRGGSHGRGKGLAFQHVNKHMRRRAVSHNPKRLPARLRQSHLAQLRKSSGGVVKKPRRPRKRYRKRSEKDILEYNRRQLKRNPMWLESHIWHAKRFHMKLLWQHKLAIAPTAKCFRSLFRAARHNVIMQDISYLSTLEISGPIETLTNGLGKLIPFGFSKIALWNREVLAHVHSTLGVYIGTIKYQWIPTKESSCGKLLLWMHPAVKCHLTVELQKVFTLEEHDHLLDFPENPTKDELKYLWKVACSPRWSNPDTRVTLKDLHGSFNRIRLVGPKVLSILKAILKIGKFELVESEQSDLTEQQTSIWNSLQKIVDVPDSTVIPLNVIDPRRELPDKRRKVKHTAATDGSYDSIPFHIQWPNFQQDSPLWCENARMMILRNKTSDELLSRSRSNNLIPGTSISDGMEPDVVPITLVFRSRDSLFPGVDLVLPCGWFMPFWVALSYRCVRSYALEFNDYLTFEEDPHLFYLSSSSLFSPDSVTYPLETQKAEKEARAKYFSYPPAKRQNLIKLGCAFSFSTDWPTFIGFLSDKEGEQASTPEVVRKTEDVQMIANCLRNLNPDIVLPNDDRLIFPVRVTLLSGAVEKGACICLPTAEDLTFLVSGRHVDIHILQLPFKDPNEQKRAELSRIHHKRLSHLRKKRSVARRAARGSDKNFDLEARLKELDSKVDVSEYNEEMNNLWLNDNALDVLAKQDREILGFTEYAHFSYVRGKSAAIGYVSVRQLKKLINLLRAEDHWKKGKRALYVLVRNWNCSLTYHWAKLEYPTSS